MKPSFTSPCVHPSRLHARERCFTCANFQGRLMALHVVCELRDGLDIVGRPRNACAFWEREPGTDDELFLSKYGTVCA